MSIHPEPAVNLDLHGLAQIPVEHRRPLLITPSIPWKQPKALEQSHCCLSRVSDGEGWRTHLGELALLVDEGDDVHGPVGDHVERILVVSELNVQPVDALQVILLLLQLEHVPHEELLQVLIGKVNAELLEATKGRGPWTCGPPSPRPGSVSNF